jgi:hypothetical protein
VELLLEEQSGHERRDDSSRSPGGKMKVPAEELDKLTAAHLEAVAADVAAAVELEKVCEAPRGDASELAAECQSIGRRRSSSWRR